MAFGIGSRRTLKLIVEVAYFALIVDVEKVHHHLFTDCNLAFAVNPQMPIESPGWR
jgi:hypothetical protein